jgi:Aminoglycoside-2''-adenylyltransferase
MFAESGQRGLRNMVASDGTPPDAWQSIEPPTAAAWLVDLDVPWWIAGGWAIDLHVGRQTRPHRDIDVGVLRRHVGVILDAFSDWEIFEAERGVLTRLARGRSPRPTVNSLWCRLQHSGCWKLELLLDDAIDDDWCYRREPSIRRPLPTVVRRDASKLPYLAPEIQLLYKARSLRPRDQRDFEQVLAHVDARGRAWLLDGLKRAEPGHSWISALSGG